MMANLQHPGAGRHAVRGSSRGSRCARGPSSRSLTVVYSNPYGTDVLAPKAGPATNPAAKEKYDYIIVGGGAAGCVMAARLTEDGRKKVLLLEAGEGGGGSLVSVPAGITRLFKHPLLDWGLNTGLEKQLGSREIYLARGKLLGGSSCTNATLYHRGSAADYDGWGLDGWRAADVLPWFIDSEAYEKGTMAAHGGSGTMCTEQPRYDNKLHAEFFRAASLSGMPVNPDFNDWRWPQEGYGEFQVSQKAGQRADMARTYLQPALKRGNLKVVTHATTSHVVFDRDAGQAAKAAGVSFRTGPAGQQNSWTAELAAGGEVVLCAGAVHSPQLLMLSGIGSAVTLRDFNIPLVADLPGVGANLQDHPGVLFAAKMRDEYKDMSVTSEVYNKSGNIKLSAILNYLLRRQGPLTTTGCDHGAFVRTPAASAGAQPDLQMRFVPACALDPDGVSSYALFGELKKKKLQWPAGITIQLLACRPHSRGSVSIRSNDPNDRPQVNINYFEREADMKTLIEGVRLARKLAEAEPLAQYLTAECFPGLEKTEDAQLEEFVRRTVHSGNALVGTCRMGASPADGSVVSSQDFKVHGVQGLRVVDASLIPVIPGGQTGAATVMIAERAAAVVTGRRQPITQTTAATLPQLAFA